MSPYFVSFMIFYVTGSLPSPSLETTLHVGLAGFVSLARTPGDGLALASPRCNWPRHGHLACTLSCLPCPDPCPGIFNSMSWPIQLASICTMQGWNLAVSTVHSALSTRPHRTCHRWRLSSNSVVIKYFIPGNT